MLIIVVNTSFLFLFFTILNTAKGSNVSNITKSASYHYRLNFCFCPLLHELVSGQVVWSSVISSTSSSYTPSGHPKRNLVARIRSSF